MPKTVTANSMQRRFSQVVGPGHTRFVSLVLEGFQKVSRRSDFLQCNSIHPTSFPVVQNNSRGFFIIVDKNALNQVPPSGCAACPDAAFVRLCSTPLGGKYNSSRTERKKKEQKPKNHH